jgi:hypothetical protein
MNNEDVKDGIYEKNTQEWVVKGCWHCDNGPAFEDAYGTRKWYFNGKRHREDGPAVEWPDGDKEWWIDGVQLTEEEFNVKTSKPTAT